MDESARFKAHEERSELRAAVLNHLRQEDLLRPDETGIERVLEACLVFLARSPSELVTVNLEDLWSETRPQNMPGTFKEYPNWQRKAAFDFEEIQRSPQVLRLLEAVRQSRAQLGVH
jgi:4-alpha-glucanotransferase